jgi:glycosyltransferase involved in cell wall biosynthesis
VAALRQAGVEIIANPPDLAPILERAEIAVFPLRSGSGTRIKALEAMAWGLPVVATARAVEGLAMVEGVHFSRAETPAEFAAAIALLAGDADLCARRAAAGRDLVASRYTEAVIHAAVSAALARHPVPVPATDAAVPRTAVA